MIVYRVICRDGVARHDKDFPTMRDAKTFADWGHCCCVRAHMILTVEVTEKRIETRCYAGSPSSHA
jgi:hypothetical protein